MRRGRWVMAVGAWVLTAGALSALGLHSVDAARDALLKAVRPAPGPPVSASPSPSPGSPRILRTPGGDIVAGCNGQQVMVRYLSPAPGFRIADADHAPGPESRVTFRSDGHAIRVVVRCAGDGPHADFAAE
ncbi:hypothetical protein [Dactylosporangium sp. CA-233914]|uniref:hypothetical protein n=1 Tax=Dactylosporangium sp. CA-233914 TaxID=3239934 RepID=UPI003D8FE44B